MSPSRKSTAATRQQFAALLRSLREAGGLSQEGLATQLGASQPYISRIETGERIVSVEEAVRWAMACGATWEETAAAVRAVWTALGGDQTTLWDG
jgi:transcriptional regulator with XRE-family HTH domain